MDRRIFTTTAIGSLIASVCPGAGYKQPEQEEEPQPDDQTGQEPQFLRIWNLGSMEHNIFPTDDTIQRLANIIQEWDGHSTLDLIWGPGLSVTQIPLNGQSVQEVIEINRPSIEEIVDTLLGCKYLTVATGITLRHLRSEMIEILKEKFNASSKNDS